MQVSWECQKIMNLPNLPVSCTSVRIPTLRAHAETIIVETEKKIDVSNAMLWMYVYAHKQYTQTRNMAEKKMALLHVILLAWYMYLCGVMSRHRTRMQWIVHILCHDFWFTTYMLCSAWSYILVCISSFICRLTCCYDKMIFSKHTYYRKQNVHHRFSAKCIHTL